MTASAATFARGEFLLIRDSAVESIEKAIAVLIAQSP
jgi:hypothetical protein